MRVEPSSMRLVFLSKEWWHKWTYLQSRNRLKRTQQTWCQVGGSVEEAWIGSWDSQVQIITDRMDKQILLYSTGSIFNTATAVSCSVASDSLQLPTRLQAPHPSHFSGKSTGVGCHFLLQGIFPTKGWTHVFCLAGGFFTTEPPEKPRYSISCDKPQQKRIWKRTYIYIYNWITLLYSRN